MPDDEKKGVESLITEMVRKATAPLASDIAQANRDIQSLRSVNQKQERTIIDLRQRLENQTSPISLAEAFMDEVDNEGFRELRGEPYSIEVRKKGAGISQVRNVDRVFHRFRPIREAAEADKVYFTKGSWWFWKSGVLTEAELATEHTAVTVTDTDQVYIIAALNRTTDAITLSASNSLPTTVDQRLILELETIEETGDPGSEEYFVGKFVRRQLGDIHEDDTSVSHTFETPVDVGAANAEGVSNNFVRGDHVHALYDHDHSGDAGDGGQVNHNDAANLNTGDYQHLTQANHTDLTDAGDTALHFHSADRARANHTGTQPASTISDFDTEVSNNESVAANTAHSAGDGSDHADVAANTAARHTRDHALDSTADHDAIAAWTESNFMGFNASGLPKDSGSKASDFATPGDLHAAVTLHADADANLLALTGQELDLDTQVANVVFAGPTTGAAAKPAFRALVDADIPAAIARDSELHAESHTITSHSDVTDATGAQLEELTGGGDTTLHDHDGISENTAARHAESHTITSHSDVTDATGAQLEELTGGGDTTLHDHDGIAENTAARHAESHTIASHSDTTATGAELETLTDGSTTALHNHANDHAEAHTIASHSDTTATGAELETLTDGSNADALHTHTLSGAVTAAKVKYADGSAWSDTRPSKDAGKEWYIAKAYVAGETAAPSADVVPAGELWLCNELDCVYRVAAPGYQPWSSGGDIDVIDASGNPITINATDGVLSGAATFDAVDAVDPGTQYHLVFNGSGICTSHSDVIVTLPREDGAELLLRINSDGELTE